MAQPLSEQVLSGFFRCGDTPIEQAQIVATVVLCLLSLPLFIGFLLLEPETVWLRKFLQKLDFGIPVKARAPKEGQSLLENPSAEGGFITVVLLWIISAVISYQVVGIVSSVEFQVQTGVLKSNIGAMSLQISYFNELDAPNRIGSSDWHLYSADGTFSGTVPTSCTPISEGVSCNEFARNVSHPNAIIYSASALRTLDPPPASLNNRIQVALYTNTTNWLATQQSLHIVGAKVNMYFQDGRSVALPTNERLIQSQLLPTQACMWNTLVNSYFPPMMNVSVIRGSGISVRLCSKQGPSPFDVQCAADARGGVLVQFEDSILQSGANTSVLAANNVPAATLAVLETIPAGNFILWVDIAIDDVEAVVENTSANFLIAAVFGAVVTLIGSLFALQGKIRPFVVHVVENYLSRIQAVAARGTSSEAAVAFVAALLIPFGVLVSQFKYKSMNPRLAGIVGAGLQMCAAGVVVMIIGILNVMDDSVAAVVYKWLLPTGIVMVLSAFFFMDVGIFKVYSTPEYASFVEEKLHPYTGEAPRPPFFARAPTWLGKCVPQRLSFLHFFLIYLMIMILSLVVPIASTIFFMLSGGITHTLAFTCYLAIVMAGVRQLDFILSNSYSTVIVTSSMILSLLTHYLRMRGPNKKDRTFALQVVITCIVLLSVGVLSVVLFQFYVQEGLYGAQVGAYPSFLVLSRARSQYGIRIGALVSLWILTVISLGFDIYTIQHDILIGRLDEVVGYLGAVSVISSFIVVITLVLVSLLLRGSSSSESESESETASASLLSSGTLPTSLEASSLKESLLDAEQQGYWQLSSKLQPQRQQQRQQQQQQQPVETEVELHSLSSTNTTTTGSYTYETEADRSDIINSYFQ